MASGPLAPIGATAFLVLAAIAYGRDWPGARWLGGAGVVTLAAALLARGLQARFWPLTSTYEFALAFAFGTGLATLVTDMKNRVGFPAGHSSSSLAAAMAVAAVLVAYAGLVVPAAQRTILPLPPTLHSVWLPLHVGTAALAYGAAALAGAAGLMWLVQPSGRSGAQRLLGQAAATSYPLLTLSILCGMAWAQQAWGRYWDWDLKEVWTFITWLVYTLFWHLRRQPHWQGRRLAWLSLIGLASVLFTFLGVGWLARAVGLESLHLF